MACPEAEKMGIGKFRTPNPLFSDPLTQALGQNEGVFDKQGFKISMVRHSAGIDKTQW
jgi:hypothetical protein